MDLKKSVLAVYVPDYSTTFCAALKAGRRRRDPPKAQALWDLIPS